MSEFAPGLLPALPPWCRCCRAQLWCAAPLDASACCGRGVAAQRSTRPAPLPPGVPGACSARCVADCNPKSAPLRAPTSSQALAPLPARPQPDEAAKPWQACNPDAVRYSLPDMLTSMLPTYTTLINSSELIDWLI